MRVIITFVSGKKSATDTVMASTQPANRTKTPHCTHIKELLDQHQIKSFDCSNDTGHANIELSRWRDSRVQQTHLHGTQHAEVGLTNHKGKEQVHQRRHCSSRWAGLQRLDFCKAPAQKHLYFKAIAPAQHQASICPQQLCCNPAVELREDSLKNSSSSDWNKLDGS